MFDVAAESSRSIQAAERLASPHYQKLFGTSPQRSWCSGCARYITSAGQFPPSTVRSYVTFIQVLVSAVDTSLRVPTSTALLGYTPLALFGRTE
jgi:hypothetical protein